MQWDASPSAGFTSGTPWIAPPENHRTINAEAELRDPDSILAFYRELIRRRKELPVIAEGEIGFLFQEVPEVFAYRRTLGEQELTVINNLTGQEVALEGAPWKYGEKVLGNYRDSAQVLRPYETVAYWSKK